jgi:TonB family protein
MNVRSVLTFERRAVLLYAIAGISLTFSGSLTAGTAAEPGGKNNEPVYDLGQGITPPRVIHEVSPKPDPGEKGFRISGVVLIGLVVSSQGLPVSVHVIKSVDKDIDQSAIDAVQQWRFEPARKDDKPVAVRVTVEIRFHDV